MSKSHNTSIGIVEVLLVVFIVLKLTRLIDWPWVWVLSPLWIAVGIMFVLVIVGTIIIAILGALE